MKIGILSRKGSLYSTRRLREAAEARGHDVRVVNYLRCYMDIHARRPTVVYHDADPARAVEEEELAKVVEKRSWENIPEEERGEGKRRRKATPGAWREDLTPQQSEAVERITASLLNEFYPQ
jgi:hypothetical protein